VIVLTIADKTHILCANWHSLAVTIIKLLEYLITLSACVYSAFTPPLGRGWSKNQTYVK